MYHGVLAIGDTHEVDALGDVVEVDAVLLVGEALAEQDAAGHVDDVELALAIDDPLAAVEEGEGAVALAVLVHTGDGIGDVEA